MGTFGLGGLHRKSTWLYPIETVAALPPSAVDGAVVIIRDTNLAFQYDALLPGWVPFPISGGGGSGTRTFNEALAGIINGTNTAFTTAVDFVANSEAVFFNGVRQHPGVGNDYTISESGGVGTGFDTVIFDVAPRSRPGSKPDDRVTIDYEPA